LLDEAALVKELTSAVCRDLPDDDPVLVARIQGGSVDALARLYDRHAPVLLALAVELVGERSRAEDLVHHVFLQLWRNPQVSSGRPLRVELLVRARKLAFESGRATDGF
jgi:DNA-directed RNA polymerase specialized sigma24 family protein